MNIFTITLVSVECAKCGVDFGITEGYMRQRRDDHANFYCPNGHINHYPQKTEAERLKQQLEGEQRQAASMRENLVAAQRAHQKAEKALERHQKRAAAGLCPCCNRTVKQLAAHMESKHPDYMQLQGLKPPKQLAEKVQ